MTPRSFVRFGIIGAVGFVGSLGGCEAVLDLQDLTDLPADASAEPDATRELEGGNEAGNEGSADATSVDATTRDAAPDDGAIRAEAGRGDATDAASDASANGAADAPADAPVVDAGLESGVDSAPMGCPLGCLASQACVNGTCLDEFASCRASGSGTSSCGADGGESCCTSLEVPTGAYSRTYQNTGSGAFSEADPASVTGFRLDKYPVTVGRFRAFVNAVLPPDGGVGWTPAPGSGKHAHLNGGAGLVGRTADGGATSEPGWVASDDANIQPTDANLTTNCSVDYATWTSSASGGQENLPINCIAWQEAYAFCIWDGGFLPSESESEYAAAGGSQQLEYPWGSTAPGTACPGTGCAYAIYNCDYPSGSGTCSSVSNIAPVGTPTLGVGRWGQLDLVGSIWAWSLDWYADAYVNPCADCAQLVAPSSGLRAARNSFFQSDLSTLLSAHRGGALALSHYDGFGVRCARVP